MVTRRQKMVWRYVRNERLKKLKAFMRKNPGVNVNFAMGTHKRSPLQLACCLKNRRLISYLLRRGADVSYQNLHGDTALHIAAKKALKHGESVYNSLFRPLKLACPNAMYLTNSDGITPQDYIDAMNRPETEVDSSSSSVEEIPDSWVHKIQVEYQNELDESFEGFIGYSDEETKASCQDWFECVSREYARSKATQTDEIINLDTEEEKEDSESSSVSSLEPNPGRREQLYLHQQRLLEERFLKKKLYDERCKAAFNNTAMSDTSKLSYEDIPWPLPNGTMNEMIGIMFHGVNYNDKNEFKKEIRNQQVLWHPDKFAQRCKDRLVDDDREKILATVTELSQELNRLAQKLQEE